MKKRILNPYKWKKKFKRGMSRSDASFDISIDDRLTLRPSYLKGDWKKDILKRKKLSWKTLFQLIILGCCIVAGLALSLFHPFFQIKSISYKGLQRVEEKKLDEHIHPLLDSKSLFVFSNKNYFLIDVEEIKNNLLSQYSFESILITKEFPHFLTIEVKEKEPAIIYDNTKEYILMGAQGEKLEAFRMVEENEWHSITKVVTSTNENGEEQQREEVVTRIHKPNLKSLIVGGKQYPVLVDKRTNTTAEYLPLKTEVIQGLTEWYELFQAKTNIPLTYTELLDGGEEGFIRTQEGWGIYVKLSDVDQAFPVFFTLLPQIDRTKAQYVDMRYLTRVYWK